MKPQASPIVITQSEYMRRMKEMAAMQPGMSFYGEMPDSFTLTLNTEHPLVKSLLDGAESDLKDAMKPLEDKLAEINKEIAALNDKRKDGKELSDEDRNTLNARENDASVTREEEDKLIADYASKQDKVKQLVDIALLGNGMLKGEALSKFLERSISLL